MNNGRRELAPPRRDGMRPKSPAEALEPGRAPSRPKGVRARRERRALSGLVRVVSGIMTVILVVMVSAGGLTLLVRHLYDRPGPLTMMETVVIPKGFSSAEIAGRLEQDGVISSRWAFMVNYLFQSRFGSKDVSLKHGEYLFKPQATIHDVIETISEGKSVAYKVTVPEGLTSQQIVERLKAEENLSGEVTEVPPEGSLLPETYSIEKGMARDELLKIMQAKQKQVLEAAWERRHSDLPLKSAQEAVVLASIIEKETGRSDERERISGVFVNRLTKGMPLQSDPTILYGVYGGAVQWGKPIMQTEKDAKNAHNTYQIKGLPATPICNPGRPALEAAVSPAKTSDLFFVADGTGGHVFTATLKDHNAAVGNWRKVEKEIRAKQELAKQEGAQTPAAGEAKGGDAKAGDAKDQPADAIPNPPAEDGAAAAPPAAAAADAAAKGTAQASTMPLPVRKPKK